MFVGGGFIQNLSILEVCFNKRLDCLITRVLLYYGFLLITLEYFPIYIMVLRFQTPWVKKIAGAESTRRQRQWSEDLQTDFQNKENVWIWKNNPAVVDFVSRFINGLNTEMLLLLSCSCIHECVFMYSCVAWIEDLCQINRGLNIFDYR